MAPEAQIYFPTGVEIPDLNKALEALGARVVETPQISLEQAITEYKRDIRTPELITTYWQAKLRIDAERAGLKIRIEVPPCNWTEEEIRRPMKEIKGNDVLGIMVPVVDIITLPVLGKMYPKMRSYTVEENTPVKDIHKTKGWVKVYASIDAPNRNTSQSKAEKFAKQQGYLGQREVTYIVAAQASKDFTDQYLDQGATWSWLPGSRSDAKVVIASFLPGGRLFADWYLFPGLPGQSGGWRFEEVKRV